MNKNIMIVGVGGQGSLLASRLLGEVFTSKGFDVKVSEVHGMAQRGGSVVTYVKYGDEVCSPVIEKGEADILVSFEELEAARYVPFLRKGGKMIVNTQQIDPMPVVTGAAQYPEQIIEKISALGIDISVLDALSLANQAGNSKATNVVLLGKLAKSLEFDKQVWLDAIVKCVKSNFVELNTKAFELGFNS